MQKYPKKKMAGESKSKKILGVALCSVSVYSFILILEKAELINKVKSPISVTYKHLNPKQDNIEDRVISNQGGGIYQEQFGYKNPKTGKLEYLTREQIIERAKNEYEYEKSKRIKELEKRYPKVDN
ncbi:hypothetical protein K9L16_00985 [Candidatus Pacearchaeota archaeon]|nr:hypothetical protein [Candidatus Pacearchaeota archaeon]